MNQDASASLQHYVKQLLDCWEEPDNVLERTIANFEYLIVYELGVLGRNYPSFLRRPHHKSIGNIGASKKLLVSSCAKWSKPQAWNYLLGFPLLRVSPIGIRWQQTID